VACREGGSVRYKVVIWVVLKDERLPRDVVRGLGTEQAAGRVDDVEEGMRTKLVAPVSMSAMVEC
jgi:hypothetical protein